ncbi:hypothetical protein ABIB25_003335 [Nakamurella sp. UYEF19]|uniref:hypothetical protein n=1 Tax=Nakamurella sp. UYEF19 TaxID=1756392 RepID=UPI00339758B3
MNTIFLASSSSSKDDSKLGTFDMSAVPEVGEIVELQGADYVVVSRRWRPKKLLSSVTVTVEKV